MNKILTLLLISILLASCAGLKVDEGDKYLRKNDIDGAVLWYKGIASADDTSQNEKLEAKVNLAYMYIVKNKLIDALVLIEKLEKQVAGRNTEYKEQLHLLKLMVYYKMSNVEYSIKYKFEDFIKKYPDSPFKGVAKYMAAVVCINSGMADEGVRYAKESLSESKDNFFNSFLLKVLADYYSRVGNYYKAEIYYNDILRFKKAEKPEKADALYWLAQYNETQGNMSKSEKYYSKIAADYPEVSSYPDSIYWLAKNAEDKNKIADAIDYYNKLINLNGESDLKEAAKKRIELLKTE